MHFTIILCGRMAILTERPQALLRICRNLDELGSSSEWEFEHPTHHLEDGYPLEVCVRLQGFNPDHHQPDRARARLIAALAPFSPKSGSIVDTSSPGQTLAVHTIFIGTPPA